MEQLKEVKLVFADYSADSFALANALIAKVNLYKKTNIMEKNVDKKNPLEELLKKHYVSGEQTYDYADNVELEDYLDRLEQKRQKC